MTFHPSIFALHLSSLLITSMILFATRYAVQILRKWNLQSGSELQLSLERKTYLVSTLLAYAFCFQLFSLFLFIFTADQIHPLFVGAMCAAGSLHVNSYGYPALLLKILTFLLAGLWLIVNHSDNSAYDYPLVKKKYALLLLIAPLMVIETTLQWNYFLRLRPDVITSCCGSLFSTGVETISSEVASLPSFPMKVLFYLALILTLGSGLLFFLRSWGGYGFALLSIVTFVTSILSIISFISLYYYELPTHHCPFCLLQKEYGHVGYPLYLCLLGGGVSGLGVGGLMPFRKIESLKVALPCFQKRLAMSSLIFYGTFGGLVTWRMIFSNLTF